MIGRELMPSVNSNSFEKKRWWEWGNFNYKLIKTDLGLFPTDDFQSSPEESKKDFAKRQLQKLARAKKSGDQREIREFYQLLGVFAYGVSGDDEETKTELRKILEYVSQTSLGEQESDLWVLLNTLFDYQKDSNFDLNAKCETLFKDEKYETKISAVAKLAIGNLSTEIFNDGELLETLKACPAFLSHCPVDLLIKMAESKIEVAAYILSQRNLVQKFNNDVNRSKLYELIVTVAENAWSDEDSAEASKQAVYDLLNHSPELFLSDSEDEPRVFDCIMTPTVRVKKLKAISESLSLFFKEASILKTLKETPKFCAKLEAEDLYQLSTVNFDAARYIFSHPLYGKQLEISQRQRTGEYRRKVKQGLEADEFIYTHEMLKFYPKSLYFSDLLIASGATRFLDDDSSDFGKSRYKFTGALAVLRGDEVDDITNLKKSQEDNQHVVSEGYRLHNVKQLLLDLSSALERYQKLQAERAQEGKVISVEALKDLDEKIETEEQKINTARAELAKFESRLSELTNNLSDENDSEEPSPELDELLWLHEVNSVFHSKNLKVICENAEGWEKDPSDLKEKVDDFLANEIPGAIRQLTKARNDILVCLGLWLIYDKKRAPTKPVTSDERETALDLFFLDIETDADQKWKNIEDLIGLRGMYRTLIETKHLISMFAQANTNDRFEKLIKFVMTEEKPRKIFIQQDFFEKTASDDNDFRLADNKISTTIQQQALDAIRERSYGKHSYFRESANEAFTFFKAYPELCKNLFENKVDEFISLLSSMKNDGVNVKKFLTSQSSWLNGKILLQIAPVLSDKEILTQDEFSSYFGWGLGKTPRRKLRQYAHELREKSSLNLTDVEKTDLSNAINSYAVFNKLNFTSDETTQLQNNAADNYLAESLKTAVSVKDKVKKHSTLFSSSKSVAKRFFADKVDFSESEWRYITSSRSKLWLALTADETKQDALINASLFCKAKLENKSFVDLMNNDKVTVLSKIADKAVQKALLDAPLTTDHLVSLHDSSVDDNFKSEITRKAILGVDFISFFKQIRDKNALANLSEDLRLKCFDASDAVLIKDYMNLFGSLIDNGAVFQGEKETIIGRLDKLFDKDGKFIKGSPNTLFANRPESVLILVELSDDKAKAIFKDYPVLVEQLLESQGVVTAVNLERLLEIGVFENSTLDKSEFEKFYETNKEEVKDFFEKDFITAKTIVENFNFFKPILNDATDYFKNHTVEIMLGKFFIDDQLEKDLVPYFEKQPELLLKLFRSDKFNENLATNNQDVFYRIFLKIQSELSETDVISLLQSSVQKYRSIADKLIKANPATYIPSILNNQDNDFSKILVKAIGLDAIFPDPDDQNIIQAYEPIAAKRLAISSSKDTQDEFYDQILKHPELLKKLIVSDVESEALDKAKVLGAVEKHIDYIVDDFDLQALQEKLINRFKDDAFDEHSKRLQKILFSNVNYVNKLIESQHSFSDGEKDIMLQAIGSGNGDGLLTDEILDMLDQYAYNATIVLKKALFLNSSARSKFSMFVQADTVYKLCSFGDIVEIVFSDLGIKSPYFRGFIQKIFENDDVFKENQVLLKKVLENEAARQTVFKGKSESLSLLLKTADKELVGLLFEHKADVGLQAVLENGEELKILFDTNEHIKVKIKSDDALLKLLLADQATSQHLFETDLEVAKKIVENAELFDQADFLIETFLDLLQVSNQHDALLTNPTEHFRAFLEEATQLSSVAPVTQKKLSVFKKAHPPLRSAEKTILISDKQYQAIKGHLDFDSLVKSVLYLESIASLDEKKAQEFENKASNAKQGTLQRDKAFKKEKEKYLNEAKNFRSNAANASNEAKEKDAKIFNCFISAEDDKSRQNIITVCQENNWDELLNTLLGCKDYYEKLDEKSILELLRDDEFINRLYSDTIEKLAMLHPGVSTLCFYYPWVLSKLTVDQVIALGKNAKLGTSDVEVASNLLNRSGVVKHVIEANSELMSELQEAQKEVQPDVIDSTVLMNAQLNAATLTPPIAMNDLPPPPPDMLQNFAPAQEEPKEPVIPPVVHAPASPSEIVSAKKESSGISTGEVKRLADACGIKRVFLIKEIFSNTEEPKKCQGLLEQLQSQTTEAKTKKHIDKLLGLTRLPNGNADQKGKGEQLKVSLMNAWKEKHPLEKKEAVGPVVSDNMLKLSLGNLKKRTEDFLGVPEEHRNFVKDFHKKIASEHKVSFKPLILRVFGNLGEADSNRIAVEIHDMLSDKSSADLGVLKSQLWALSEIQQAQKSPPKNESNRGLKQTPVVEYVELKVKDKKGNEVETTSQIPAAPVVSDAPAAPIIPAAPVMSVSSNVVTSDVAGARNSLFGEIRRGAALNSANKVIDVKRDDGDLGSVLVNAFASKFKNIREDEDESDNDSEDECGWDAPVLS